MKLKMTPLLDVATVEERAISNKVYPAHSITLQISATRGQLHFLTNPSTIESHYAVIVPKPNINPRYLYECLKMNITCFLQRYQEGLNFRAHNLKYMILPIHQDAETQEIIANVSRLM